MKNDVIMFALPIMFIGFFVIKNKIIGSTFIILGYFMGISNYIANKLLKTSIDLFTLLRIDADMIAMSPYVLNKFFFKSIGLTLIILLLVLLKLGAVSHKRVIEKIKTIYAQIKILLIYSFVSIKNLKVNYLIKIISVIAVCLLTFNFTLTGNAWCKIINDCAEYIKYSQLTGDDLFKKLGADNKYIYEQDLKAQPGKNLVIIYCESLENGYFDNTLFPNVTPKMNKLITNNEFISYMNYENCIGSGWTIGALYTTQTGMPCFFASNNGNVIFNRVKDTQIVSYAKVLKSAGYNNLFMSSSRLDFAGTGNMMRMLGYDIKNYDEFDVPCSKTTWGVHDKDLFEQAKIEYSNLIKLHKPFNITLLTVDTHFTKGLPDERLSNIVGKQFTMDKIEYSVNSLDYLLEDFYTYIKSQPNSDNTEIIILGDHPLMGSEDNTPATKLLNKTERNITLLSSKKSNLYDVNDKLRYYDIPDFILDVAGVESNAVFSKDLFTDMSPDKIKSEGVLFTHLNLKLLN